MIASASRLRVSVVIPTRNGMSTLPAVISAIRAQRTDADVEVVGIDSASTDGTTQLLRDRGATVIEIARDAFNHGTARNQAIGAAHGDLIVLLSQDAEPAGPDWLDALLRPLLDNLHVAGSFARQRHRPSAGAIVRHYHARWMGSTDAARVVRIASAQAFEHMTPAERLDVCTFDNVCSCIRRSVWEHHPFPAAAIAEDVAWAKTVLLAGFALAYAPDAVVVHSHDRPASYEYTRTVLLHHQLHELVGLRTIPTAGALARSIASSMLLHLRCRSAAGGTMPVESLARGLALAVAWPLGQYVGGRRAAGRRPILEAVGV